MKYLKDRFDFILEQYKFTDFKFGFEFEALYPHPNLISTQAEHDEVLHNLANGLSAIDPIWKNGKIVPDGSVRTRGEIGNFLPFEYNSPILTFNSATVKKVIDFLDITRDSLGIVVNKTCGFHIHLSFPDITSQDLYWAICQLSIDPIFFNKITNFKGIPFYSDQYAPLDKFKFIATTIRSESYAKLYDYVDDKKYNMFRIHPQGTLEWRGPRLFMTSHSNIISFFKLLKDLILYIRKSLDKQYLNTLSRDGFNSIVANKKVHDKYTEGDLKLVQLNLIKNLSDDGKVSLDDDELLVSGGVFSSKTSFEKINFENVVIKDGTFNTCEFTNCVIDMGSFRDCSFFKSDNSHEIILNDGEFDNCLIYNAIINNGAFSNSSFYQTNNLGSTFNNGTLLIGNEFSDSVEWVDGHWTPYSKVFDRNMIVSSKYGKIKSNMSPLLFNELVAKSKASDFDKNFKTLDAEVLKHSGENSIMTNIMDFIADNPIQSFFKDKRMNKKLYGN